MEEALLDLEVAPLHASLMALLNPELVESWAQLSIAGAAVPACGQGGWIVHAGRSAAATEEALNARFATEALAIYGPEDRLACTHSADHGKWAWAWLAGGFASESMQAMGLPALEDKFVQPWFARSEDGTA